MEKKIEGKTVYQNSFLAIDEDRVILDNGHLATRIVVRHIGASAVLALTKDHQIILTQQYRYPIGKVSLEIPAGKKDDPRDDPKATVIRELYEETGYVCQTVRFMRQIHPCVGYSDEVIDLFMACDCIMETTSPPQDSDEDITLRLVTKAEAEELIKNGQITDSKTLIALLAHLNHTDGEKPL